MKQELLPNYYQPENRQEWEGDKNHEQMLCQIFDSVYDVCSSTCVSIEVPGGDSQIVEEIEPENSLDQLGSIINKVRVLYAQSGKTIQEDLIANIIQMEIIKRLAARKGQSLQEAGLWFVKHWAHLFRPHFNNRKK